MGRMAHVAHPGRREKRIAAKPQKGHTMRYDLTSLRSYAVERPEYPQNVRERRTWLFLKYLRRGRGPAATRTLYRYVPDFHLAV